MRKLVLLFFALPIIIQCTANQKFQPVEQTRLLMDTFVQIVVYNDQKSNAELNAIIEKALDRIKQIDQITNFYNDSSLISYVNQTAGNQEVSIDSVLAEILSASGMISELTDGNFDVTIGKVKKLWPFSSEQPVVPDSAKIIEALKYVDYKLIELKNNKIKFSKPGIQIDLGGIAKGYAIDEAIKVLQNNGIKDALVNAGGDLRAICSKLTCGKRKIWIKHPRKPEAFFGHFRMDEGSVATSGDYERFFIIDSVRYFHILNPKTGYPARKCVSVTIQASNAMLADALATVVFVMGPEKGMIFVKSLPNVECIILFEKNNQLNYVATDGITDIKIIN